MATHGYVLNMSAYSVLQNYWASVFFSSASSANKELTY